MEERVRAYLALGANLGEPLANVTGAIADLGQVPGISLKDRSPLYRTPPLGPSGQPDYINAVIEVCTDLDPEALLDACQGVERAYGRVRDGARWGPRTLDVDVLLYGDRTIASERLTVPHPEMTRRAFVMVPLAALAPEVEVPGHGRAGVLAATLEHDGLERL